ncbi:lysoplasmalogenase [Longivirga aurantiaca]|uniref:Lysoplasmalogenase n=1 Tax=Longivirga aurantiaca TaxID=1837743 RepID=A0ABW1SW52_9ACTN
MPSPRGVFAAFVAVCAVNVVAVGVGLEPVATATKPFIVGLLLVWAWLATDRRPPRLLMAGLAFALLGDVLFELPGTLAFLAGIVAFLVMQVCYIRGFLRLGAGAWLRDRPVVVVGWALLWVALNVALGPLLGELRWPITVYSLALVAMAACALATGSRLVGVGGVLFLVSDLLIGLRAADVSIPASGVLVMATYAAAQVLITVGWVALARSRQGAQPAVVTG